MAITRISSNNGRAQASAGSRRLIPAITAIFTGLLLGLMLTQLGYAEAAMVFIGIAAVAVAIISPYWALVIGVAQWAFIPSEGTFLWIETTPNQLQFIGPLLIVAALLCALKERAHDRLRPRMSDFSVGGLGLWGLIGLLANGYPTMYKWYTNRMILPMAYYYATRMVGLTRERAVKLLVIALVAVALQSVLMIRQSMAGSSPIYGHHRGLLEGIKPAIGPFIYHWSAGTFLTQWPAIFVYMIAREKNVKKKILWIIALIAVLIAATRTMQRAPILAALLGISLCVLSSRLRRTTVGIIALLALLYVPWSTGSAGGSLLDRFDETDQSRYARRAVALNLLRSPRWDPIFGMGWTRGHIHGSGLGTDDEVVIWGRRATTVSFLETSRFHNVWLQIPIELGGVGALITVTIILSAVASSLRILRRARERATDTGLLVALWGSLLGVGAIGYYQHVWHMPASMSVMWLVYGMIVSDPRLFDIEPSEA